MLKCFARSYLCVRQTMNKSKELSDIESRVINRAPYFNSNLTWISSQENALMAPISYKIHIKFIYRVSKDAGYRTIDFLGLNRRWGLSFGDSVNLVLVFRKYFFNNWSIDTIFGCGGEELNSALIFTVKVRGRYLR